MFQTALDKKPAAICLAAVDSKAFQPLLEKAKAAGIPIVGFDSGVDSDIPVSTAATDNIAAAAMAADKMAELIGGSGEVAIIAHDQTAAPASTALRASPMRSRPSTQYQNRTTQYGGGPAQVHDLAKRSSRPTRI